MWWKCVIWMHCTVRMWWNGAGRSTWQSVWGIPTFPAGNGPWYVQCNCHRHILFFEMSRMLGNHFIFLNKNVELTCVVREFIFLLWWSLEVCEYMVELDCPHTQLCFQPHWLVRLNFKVCNEYALNKYADFELSYVKALTKTGQSLVLFWCVIL